MKWHWPLGAIIRQTGGPLFKITYPIALSEMLWGTNAFVYVVIFTRISTETLASSQIVTTIENLFIVAASGLAPAAVATVGQALWGPMPPEALGNKLSACFVPRLLPASSSRLFCLALVFFSPALSPRR
jgi:hypothetical protein